MYLENMILRLVNIRRRKSLKQHMVASSNFFFFFDNFVALFSYECFHFRSYFQSITENDENNFGVIGIIVVFSIGNNAKYKNLCNKAAICSVLTI